MIQMKKLLDQFEEEIEGVKEYSECSKAAKDDPDLSKMYLEMAVAEHGHAQKLYNVLVKKAAQEMTPEEAKEILDQMWKEQECDMLEKLARARGYLDMVK